MKEGPPSRDRFFSCPFSNPYQLVIVASYRMATSDLQDDTCRESVCCLSGCLSICDNRYVPREMSSPCIRSVQEAVQENIDFTGVNSLDYMLACIDEAFRLYPPIPGALLRKTREDDIICGQYVPPNVRFLFTAVATTS